MKIFSYKKILVLGVTGTIGGSLYNAFKELSLSVDGSARAKEKDSPFFFFDGITADSMNLIPWHEYDLIIDCIGAIDYTKTTETSLRVVAAHTSIPLSILSRLQKNQTYVYCSTHAVGTPMEMQTPYALSKKFFEDLMRVAHPVCTIVIFRLPAIFFETRTNGLIAKIKHAFVEKKELSLRIHMSQWHVMYLPRLISLFTDILSHRMQSSVIPLGYPTETSVKKIIGTAKKVFGYSIPVTFSEYVTDHFIPDIHIQDTYISISASAFEDDLEKYFLAV